MSTQTPQVVATRVSPKTRIGIAAARFNAQIVDELLAGCLRRLVELGIDPSRIQTARVPGAFELPVTAKAFARTGRFDAVICLGAVVRGETPHFDYVAGEAARGIQDVAIWENLPVIFGVYLATPWNPVEHMHSSLDRLLFQLWPSIIYATAVAIPAAASTPEPGPDRA